MPTYSYAECLSNSYRVNWRIADVIGGQHFDPARPWLPARLSGAGRATRLTALERLRLNQVEMGAYAHLFGFVEEAIAPRMVGLARNVELDEREAFDALTNFAAEEVKHMALFREVSSAVDDALGFPLTLLPGARDVARVVLGKSVAASLLLIDAIEWMTQRHYLTSFKDDASLDPFTQHIYRAHWVEESQHARLDHLETLRAFRDLAEPQKDQAFDDLIELVRAVDGLLQTQAGMDVDNLQRALGYALGVEARQDVLAAVLAAKRYTFIETGVTHPNFLDLFGQVATPTQQQKVERAVGGVLAPAA